MEDILKTGSMGQVSGPKKSEAESHENEARRKILALHAAHMTQQAYLTTIWPVDRLTLAARDALEAVLQRIPLNVSIWRVDSPGVGL